MNYKGSKVSYSRWLYATEMLESLHETLGSWTEVSRAVLGHGDSPGWAKESMSYRTNVKPHHVRAMEKLLAPPSRAPEGDASGKYLSEDQKKAYKEILGRLFHEYKWTNAEIGEALGITPNAVYTARKFGGGTVARLTRAQQIIDRLGRDAPPEVVEEKEEPTLSLGDLEAGLTLARETAVALAEHLHSLRNGLPRAFARQITRLARLAEQIDKELDLEDEEGKEAGSLGEGEGQERSW